MIIVGMLQTFQYKSIMIIVGMLQTLSLSSHSCTQEKQTMMDLDIWSGGSREELENDLPQDVEDGSR